jgi:hypothetical protein
MARAILMMSKHRVPQVVVLHVIQICALLLDMFKELDKQQDLSQPSDGQPP